MYIERNLISLKMRVAAAGARLVEEDRPARLELDRDRDRDHQRREEDDQRERRRRRRGRAWRRSTPRSASACRSRAAAGRRPGRASGRRRGTRTGAGRRRRSTPASRQTRIASSSSSWLAREKAMITRSILCGSMIASRSAKRAQPGQVRAADVVDVVVDDADRVEPELVVVAELLDELPGDDRRSRGSACAGAGPGRGAGRPARSCGRCR